MTNTSPGITTILSSKHFDVTVDTIPEWKQPVYVVTSRAYKVVEFAHPIHLYVRQWIRDMEEQITQQDLVEAGVQVSEINPLDPKHYQ